MKHDEDTENRSMTRGIGHTQRYMLGMIHREGPWYCGCGWYYYSHRRTEDLFLGLVRRGLVEAVQANGRTEYHLKNQREN